MMGDSEAAMIAVEQGCSIDEAKVAMGEPAALKRLGNAEDVADVVAFLASGAARFLTGVALPVTEYCADLPARAKRIRQTTARGGMANGL